MRKRMTDGFLGLPPYCTKPPLSTALGSEASRTSKAFEGDITARGDAETKRKTGSACPPLPAAQGKLIHSPIYHPQLPVE